MNEQSEEALLARIRQDGRSVESEIQKVPHHGAAEFDPRLLEAVRAVVSVVSSGDESAAKEYIHPRALLLGALGKYSRASVARPLVFVTEMVASMESLGITQIRRRQKNGEFAEKSVTLPRTYSKKQFGIVHVRTDGEARPGHHAQRTRGRMPRSHGHARPWTPAARASSERRASTSISGMIAFAGRRTSGG